MAERAVVAGATLSSLLVNISNWSKREGTSTGRREREPESEIDGGPEVRLVRSSVGEIGEIERG